MSRYNSLYLSIIFLINLIMLVVKNNPCYSSNKGYNDKNFAAKKGCFNEYAVSGLNKASVKIGKDIIASGGNAMDAVLAMQVAIGLTEAHASGLGGGGYILYFNKKTGQITTYDGREVAPVNASIEYVFGKSEQRDIKIKTVVRSEQAKNELNYREEFDSRYIGVPGILSAMDLAYNDHASKPWGNLFEPTIQLAKKGFTPEPRLQYFYNRYSSDLPDIKNLFRQNTFDKLRFKSTNEEMARTLELIAKKDGVINFYQGGLAERIANTAQKSGSILTKQDLASYKSVKAGSMCIGYKEYKICTRADHFTPLLALKILEKYDLQNASEADTIFQISNAIDIALANRRKYQQDGFTDGGLIIREAEQTLSNFNQAQIHSPIKTAIKTANKKINTNNSITGTTSFFAIDTEGNIAVVASSVNGYFGSGITAEGIVLNNTMLDFADCKSCTNEVQPGKRPTSSMSPIIVFDKNGKPVFGASSAGGIRILTYVVSTLINMMEKGLDPQQSINTIKYTRLRQTKCLTFLII